MGFHYIGKTVNAEPRAAQRGGCPLLIREGAARDVIMSNLCSHEGSDIADPTAPFPEMHPTHAV